MLELFPGLLLQTLLTGLAVLLAGALLLRPDLARSRGGVALAAVAFAGLPLLALYMGAEQHLLHSKQTVFCLSCHSMHPYGASLLEEPERNLAAVHFRNELVPRERACYVCHTQYTMFGGLQAKLNGMRHMWRAWVSGAPDPIELYGSYENRECLECHARAPSFLEARAHGRSLEPMRSGELSCLVCHAPAHGVEPGAVSDAVEGGRELRLPEEAERDGGPAWSR